MTGAWIGKAVDRIDGPAKVRGAAKYAADYAAEDLLYGFIVSSHVARGRVTGMDLAAAKATAGVVHILTHDNRPHMAWFNRSYKDMDAPSGEHFRPLYDNEIHFNMQPLALVIATSFEAARLAASLVQIDVEETAVSTSLKGQLARAQKPKHGRDGVALPKSRGHAARAMEQAAVHVDASYSTPVEHHNPMEMHATTVLRDAGGHLTIYDKTQSAQNTQQYLCQVFGLAADDVQVVSHYVGGAFGSGLRPQHQAVLAVMAALTLERSVRVVLTRQQMFSFGHRPGSEQHLQLGVNEQGQLKAMIHTAVCETSRVEEYVEQVINWTGVAYECPDVELDYKLVHLDLHTPLDMRAPGAAVGMFALESAVDELAVALKMDPLQLRLINHASSDQSHHSRSFSTKELLNCYSRGAAKFGWAKRPPETRARRSGEAMIGWGMATGIWEAGSQPATARALLMPDGHLTISSATSDMGTGTYTIMAQIAAESLGVDLHQVTPQLGDSSLPKAPLAGGSWTAASVGDAVKDACRRLRHELFTLAREHPNSPFTTTDVSDLDYRSNAVYQISDPTRVVQLVDLLAAAKQPHLAALGETKPSLLNQLRYTKNTHSAVFVEVKVDEDLGMVEVTRVVCAVDAGRILNPKTARSQIIGGVIWGISMALHEESALDHNFGRFMNHSFAEYHIPVAKDIGSIEVLFIEEPDTVVSALGVKGLGEIGVVGTAAAVANAVYHATGKRIRDLPITPAKLM